MTAFLSSYQTLGPCAGWRVNRREELPYPLSHARSQRYYLGRNAVYHGAQALGLGTGDEIVFPAWHSGTESAPLMHLGCKLRFYEVYRDLSIDPAEVEARITPATKAIYAIHFIGFPAPIVELREIADRHGLRLIEDVALGLTGQVAGRPMGTTGDISIFCLYKSLPTAAGGILGINRQEIPLPPPPVTTNHYSELNLTVKRFLDHSEMHGGWLGENIRHLIQLLGRKGTSAAGLKVNSPDALDFEPQLLDAQMGQLTEWIAARVDYRRVYERRRENFLWLARELEGTGVHLLRDDLPEGAVPLFFPVWTEDKFGTVARMVADGIDTVPVWGIHHRHLPHGEFPHTEFLTRHAIEVPVHQTLTVAHLRRIRDSLIRHARWDGFTDAAKQLEPIQAGIGS